MLKAKVSYLGRPARIFFIEERKVSTDVEISQSLQPQIDSKILLQCKISSTTRHTPMGTCSPYGQAFF
jgi:hypothetical protein